MQERSLGAYNLNTLVKGGYVYARVGEAWHGLKQPLLAPRSWAAGSSMVVTFCGALHWCRCKVIGRWIMRV